MLGYFEDRNYVNPHYQSLELTERTNDVIKHWWYLVKENSDRLAGNSKTLKNSSYFHKIYLFKGFPSTRIYFSYSMALLFFDGSVIISFQIKLAVY